MWRAIMITAIAIIVCGIAYITYRMKKEPEIWLCSSEYGPFDVTCLEQKVFVRLMQSKAKKLVKVQGERKI